MLKELKACIPLAPTKMFQSGSDHNTAFDYYFSGIDNLQELRYRLL
jgi:hypothetical protein